MADEPLTSVEEDIAVQAMGDEGRIIKKAKWEPTYRMIGDSKIPVSKKYGPLWKSRMEQGEKKMKDSKDIWEEAIRYFDNDQTNHRYKNEGKQGSAAGSGRGINNQITETENIVFSNITTMVAALYARNPMVEFTANNDEYKKLATCVERVVNTLLAKKSAPGVNLKPKARRGVTTALLTNRAWLEVNWIFKNDSSEQALADLKDLAVELEKAKEEKQIEELEGKISALDAQVSILQPSGPVFRLRHPNDIIIDWSAEEQDGSDAKWIIVLDWIPTTFLKAKWGKKRKDSDQYESIYEPSHILKIGSKEGEEGHESNSFSLFEDDGEGKAFGYDDVDAFEKAKMTRVAFVWDKVTRRVFMYNVKDWTWPIWVWDDPLQLDTFYNVFSLYYHDGPCGLQTKGEVAYYLDQQDAVNEITSEEQKARRWARRNVFFNKNLTNQKDVESVLAGDDGTARGLDIPEGMKLGDVIGSILPPSMQFQQLFDKQSKYQAIDRISGLGQVLREGQFKTNANKDAVKFGASMASMRVDDKSDQIEDWLGAAGWALGQLCLQHMPVEQVVSLIGQEAATDWKNLSAEEIAGAFGMQVVGGSTKKPTSQAKKEEALELGQVLGQFVNAAPMAVTKIMLEVFQQAFDEITMKDEDWEALKQEMGLMAQQQAAPSGAGAGGQSPVQGSDPQTEQIKQTIAQLPPEVQQQLQALVQQGVPPSQALQQVTQQTVQ